jgi:hypothetical protein
LVFGNPLSTIITFLYYLSKPVLYIFALVITINGPQGFWAVVFYILFGIQVPKIIYNFVGSIIMIVCVIREIVCCKH